MLPVRNAKTKTVFQDGLTRENAVISLSTKANLSKHRSIDPAEKVLAGQLTITFAEGNTAEYQ